MNLLDTIEKFAELLAADFLGRGHALQYGGTPLTPEQVGARHGGTLPVILAHSATLMSFLSAGAGTESRIEIARWLGGLTISTSESGRTVVAGPDTQESPPIAPILLFLNESFEAAARLSPSGVVDFHTLVNPPKSSIAYFLERITHGDAVYPEAQDAPGTDGGGTEPGAEPGADGGGIEPGAEPGAPR